MNGQTDELPDMLAEARRPGDYEPPTQLLQALREAGGAVPALLGQADDERFSAAFVSDFGYFPPGGPAQPPLAAERRARWVTLFRWIFAELPGWTAEAEGAGETLVAILIAAQSARGGRQLWAGMPDAIAQNTALMRLLKTSLRSLTMEFTVRGGASEPIWEREAVEEYKAADQAGDWTAIGASLHLFEHQLFHQGVVLTQSARLLARCGLDHLVEATSAIRQTLVTLGVADAVGRGTALSLGAASENAYVQFACLQRAISAPRQARPLDDEERRDMSAILSRVAVELDRWTAWMQVFNTYPVRFPLLQEPLGRALATVDEPAMRAYVNSVQLFPWQVGAQHGGGRRAVAECLRAFQAAAPPVQRQTLWQLAFERWNAWNFGRESQEQHLFAIHWSDLDFAVVAFACECLDEDERQRQLDEIRLELQDLDLQWHESISTIYTAWHRLCSRFQPFAHAVQALQSGADWLNETSICLPPELVTNLYVRQKFGMQ